MSFEAVSITKSKDAPSHPASEMQADVVMKGMLHKLSGEYGGKSKYNWDHRFVWLTNDGIYWSKKEESFKAKNSIKLD